MASRRLLDEEDFLNWWYRRDRRYQRALEQQHENEAECPDEYKLVDPLDLRQQDWLD